MTTGLAVSPRRIDEDAGKSELRQKTGGWELWDGYGRQWIGSNAWVCPDHQTDKEGVSSLRLGLSAAQCTE